MENQIDSYYAVLGAIHVHLPLDRFGDDNYNNLTLDEMQFIMQTNEGLKAAHRNYMDDEYLTYSSGKFVTEDNQTLRDIDWAVYRNTPNLKNKGWCVFNSPN